MKAIKYFILLFLISCIAMSYKREATCAKIKLRGLYKGQAQFEGGSVSNYILISRSKKVFVYAFRSSNCDSIESHLQSGMNVAKYNMDRDSIWFQFDSIFYGFNMVEYSAFGVNKVIKKPYYNASHKEFYSGKIDSQRTITLKVHVVLKDTSYSYFDKFIPCSISE